MNNSEKIVSFDKRLVNNSSIDFEDCVDRYVEVHDKRRKKQQIAKKRRKKQQIKRAKYTTLLLGCVAMSVMAGSFVQKVNIGRENIYDMVKESGAIEHFQKNYSVYGDTEVALKGAQHQMLTAYDYDNVVTDVYEEILERGFSAEVAYETLDYMGLRTDYVKGTTFLGRTKALLDASTYAGVLEMQSELNQDDIKGVSR